MSRVLSRDLLIGVRRNDYTVTDARTVFGLAFLAAQLFGTIGLLAFGTSEVSSVMIQAAFFITVAVYSSIKGINMQNAAKYKRCDFRFLILAVVAVPFSLLMAIPIQELWFKLLELIGVNVAAIAGGTTTMTALEAVIYTIVVSVGPMLGEEAVMRGVVVNGYANDKGRLQALFISAALFALLHGNALQLINPFISGAVMALFMIKSDSIYPGMIMHCINNFSVTVISFTCEAQVDAFLENNLILSFIVGAIGLAAVIFAVLRLGKDIKLDNKPIFAKETVQNVDVSSFSEGERLIYAECFTIKKQKESMGIVLLVVAMVLCGISIIVSLI